MNNSTNTTLRTLLDLALLLRREEGRGPRPPRELVELRLLHVRHQLPLERPEPIACLFIYLLGEWGLCCGVVLWGVVGCEGWEMVGGMFVYWGIRGLGVGVWEWSSDIYEARTHAWAYFPPRTHSI